MFVQYLFVDTFTIYCRHRASPFVHFLSSLHFFADQTPRHNLVNMHSLLLTLLPVVAASVVPRQYFSFGNSFSTGPTASGTYIIEATTTLVLPNLQSPHDGNLGLWPGMGMDDGDLVQGLAISTIGWG